MRKFTLFLIFVLLGIGQAVMATTYTTTGKNSWSPSTPGRNLNSSDDFVISHEVILYGLNLQNGGSISVRSGGELKFKWSASFQSGSTVTVEPGGELNITQITLTNYSENFEVSGDLNTTNGTMANYSPGEFRFSSGGTWYMNQFTLVNYSSLVINEDASWKNGTVSFASGTVEINSEVEIKNLTLQNNASLIGYGQIDIANGNATFSSNGDINGCTGQSCIPPATIGSITYLAAPIGGGSTFTPYTGGALPSTTCNTTVQAVADMIIPADMVIGDLIISPGVTVTVEEEKTLTVCRAIANEGIFLIENKGSLVQNSVNDENSGNGVYKIVRNGTASSSEYNSWSSPLQAAELSEVFKFSNPCDVYTFDAFSQSWLYDYPNGYSTTCNGNSVTFNTSFIITGADGVMDVGRGYFVPGSSANNRVIEGKVNNGDVTINLHETSLGNKPDWNLDDWNLVGNPYPCAIDLNAFYAENSGVIAGGFHFWVDDQQNGTDYHQSDDYAVFANNVGTSANGGTATRYVATAQAFWVYALSDAPLKFTNAMRVTGNNADLFKTEEEPEEVFVYLDITNDSLNFNQCAVGFNKESTNGYDIKSDAVKGEAGTGITIASLIDGNPYTIQAIEEVTDNKSYAVSLQVSSNNAGLHTISASRLQNVGPNVHVYLVDKTLNQTIDIKMNPYTVHLDTGLYSSRFLLKFENTGTTVGTNEIEAASNLKVFSQGEFLVAQLLGHGEMETITVYDLQGKELLRNTHIKNSVYQMPIDNLSNGVYLIKVVTQKGEQITTKVSVVR